MKWLKHAFAVDPPGPAEPTDEQRPVVEKVCREIVRRRLTTPAVAFIEMSRPMNYLGAQALHFFAPFIAAVTDARGHKHFAAFLENRGSIDYILQRVEEIEDDATRRDAQQDEDETTATRRHGEEEEKTGDLDL